jgi:hypothetical protein
MNHIDEHVLELHVLNGGATDSGIEIEAHLRVCRGCRDLAAQMHAFYLDAERHYREHPVDLPAAQKAVARSAQAIELWMESIAVPARRHHGAPVARARELLRQHPVAMAGGSFAVLAIVALLLNTLVVGRGTPSNPSYVSFNPGTGMVRIHAATDSVLWEKPASQISQPGFLSLPAKSAFAFQDLDGDGINEIITGFTFDGDRDEASTDLRVFNWKKQLVNVRSFNRPVPFAGRNYDPIFRSGSVTAGDLLGPGTGGCIALTANLRSPSFAARFDRSLREVGTYWHFGQLGSSVLMDITGDGRPEYLVGGENDLADTTGNLVPVLAVLDPAQMVGDGRASACSGFLLPVSPAELWYVAFPWTDLDSLEARQPAVQEILQGTDRSIVVILSNGQPGRIHSSFTYVFSPAMELREVRASAETRRLHAMLLEGRRVHQPLDTAYLDRLSGKVRYWSGGRWQRGATRVAGRDLAARPVP